MKYKVVFNNTKIVMAMSKAAFGIAEACILNTWSEDEKPVFKKIKETDDAIICTFQSDKAVDFYKLGKITWDLSVLIL